MTEQARKACVLLSGGMDSTACLHWALAKYGEVRAVGFDYGQPQRDAELLAAGRVARRRGVPFEIIVLADTLHSGILASVPAHESAPTTAIHRAFVPGRNLVFLSVALSRAMRWWPETPALDLVIGAVAEDTAGFPDCTRAFLDAARSALSMAVAADVQVMAPFNGVTKAQMLALASYYFPDALADIQESWSCYAGCGPCGTCTPCVLRASALAEAGLTDLATAPTMTGGDVGRERGFS